MALLDKIASTTIRYSGRWTMNPQKRPSVNPPVLGAEKPPKLILNSDGAVSESLIHDCMTPIFKFLPTSELFRFASNLTDNPPLGEFWSRGFRRVFEIDRLPLALKCVLPEVAFGVDFHHPQTPNHFALVDRFGIMVAHIKRPHLFRDSPLCDLTESAVMPAFFHVATHSLFIEQHVQQLILPIQNVVQLTLAIGVSPSGLNPAGHLVSNPALQPFFARIVSFEYAWIPPSAYMRCAPTTDRISALERLTSLKHLRIDALEFCAAVPGVPPHANTHPYAEIPHPPEAVLAIFSRLESLHVTSDWKFGLNHVNNSEYSILQFLRTRCTQLSELSIYVTGDTRLYFAAFRAMPGLVKLGLWVEWRWFYRYANEGYRSLSSSGLGAALRMSYDVAIIDNEDAIGSVKHLLIDFDCTYKKGACLVSMLSKFPSIESLRVEFKYLSDAMEFVTEVRAKGGAVHLRKVSCSSDCGPEVYAHETKADFVIRVIGNTLPIIDISHDNSCFFDATPENLALLVQAMQRNSLTSLTLKGDVSKQALNAFLTAMVNAPQIQAVAWRDEWFLAVPNLGLSRRATPFHSEGYSYSDFTDVKMTGCKTEGPLKGEQFTVRFCTVPADENPFFYLEL